MRAECGGFCYQSNTPALLSADTAFPFCLYTLVFLSVGLAEFVSCSLCTTAVVVLHVSTTQHMPLNFLECLEYTQGAKPVSRTGNKTWWHLMGCSVKLQLYYIVLKNVLFSFIPLFYVNYTCSTWKAMEGFLAGKYKFRKCTTFSNSIKVSLCTYHIHQCPWCSGIDRSSRQSRACFYIQT